MTESTVNPCEAVQRQLRNDMEAPIPADQLLAEKSALEKLGYRFKDGALDPTMSLNALNLLMNKTLGYGVPTEKQKQVADNARQFFEQQASLPPDQRLTVPQLFESTLALPDVLNKCSSLPSDVPISDLGSFNTNIASSGSQLLLA